MSRRPCKPGECAGWRAGEYRQGDCRLCHLGRNPATLNGRIAPTASTSRARAASLPVVADTCIDLGDVEERCSMGDIHQCRSVTNIVDGVRVRQCSPTPRVKNHLTPSCLKCEHRRTLSSIATVAVTEWQRPESLSRLLTSLGDHLPAVPVLTENTNGNLSAGRNRLYARVKSLYLVMMEEDFVVVPETVAGIRDAVTILEHDKGIAGVGGVAREAARGAVRWGHDFRLDGERCFVVPSRRPMRNAQGVRYRPCQLTLNWGVFRTDLFRRVAWDEQLELQEHQDFYYRASRAGHLFALLPSLVIEHHRDRPNATYNASRQRDFSDAVRSKHGFAFEKDSARPKQRRTRRVI